MIGGLLKTTSLAALLAVGGLIGGISQAKAADLGGDCCADLEERVAELEATTARKGNRKVSLTVSGWVNEAVLFWDDGHESNVYQATHMVSQTRFRFTGSAAISADWSAGYVIEVGVAGSRSDGVDAANDDNGAGLSVRNSAWYLQSKTLGKLTVGQFSSATDGLIDAHVANIGHFTGENAAAMVGAFRARTPGGGFGPRLNAFMGGGNLPGTPGTDPGQIGEGNRNNLVRYDSPAMAGFTLSAAWGEDDMWDVALRYAGEFSGFKLMANVGYQEWRDGNDVTRITAANTAVSSNGERNCVSTNAFGNGGPSPDVDCQQFGIFGGIMHTPTGLFVEGGYGIRWDDNVDKFFPGFDDTSTQWFVMAGIEQKFFALGKTTIFGEYQQWNVGLTNSGWTCNNSANIRDCYQSAEMTAWGIGINQQIDAAAMDLYIHYRNYDPKAVHNPDNVFTQRYENFHQLMAGGRIQF